MVFKTTSSINTSRRSEGGFTLVEYMVGTFIAGIILVVILSLVLYSGRNFASLANYAEMQTTSINAIDTMSQDIRQTTALTGYTTNSLTFDFGANGTLKYTYSASAGTLTRTLAATSKVLLTSCDSMSFAVYQRTPVAGTWDQFAIGDTNETKVIQVRWKCSRSIFGQKISTEEEQTAKIVIRSNE